MRTAGAPASSQWPCAGSARPGGGLRLHLRDDDRAAVGLTPATDYPVNLGMARPEGWKALAVLDTPDRTTTPLLRDANGKLASADWDTAMPSFVDRFKSIQHRHGPDSLNWLGTGQIATEELAFLGALAKFALASATATATPASAWRRPSRPTSNPSASTPHPTPTNTSKSPT